MTMPRIVCLALTLTGILCNNSPGQCTGDGFVVCRDDHAAIAHVEYYNVEHTTRITPLGTRTVYDHSKAIMIQNFDCQPVGIRGSCTSEASLSEAYSMQASISAQRSYSVGVEFAGGGSLGLASQLSLRNAYSASVTDTLSILATVGSTPAPLENCEEIEFVPFVRVVDYDLLAVECEMVAHMPMPRDCDGDGTLSSKWRYDDCNLSVAHGSGTLVNSSVGLGVQHRELMPGCEPCAGDTDGDGVLDENDDESGWIFDWIIDFIRDLFQLV